MCLSVYVKVLISHIFLFSIHVWMIIAKWMALFETKTVNNKCYNKCFHNHNKRVILKHWHESSTSNADMRLELMPPKTSSWRAINVSAYKQNVGRRGYISFFIFISVENTRRFQCPPEHNVSRLCSSRAYSKSNESAYGDVL